ncbi:MAG TPA: gephyrin-like molybdotransferase Glp [Pyrinomonadaceae bacterium]|jgi:molybdenum cofactor synthesis domain-containing protein|nr:gephyrin-like molybdotransferase Glp [Pyrinomonadaceae bacterium]
MISVSEAIRIVREQTPKLPPETISLEHARGRFLAQDVVADSDLPPFDRSQMDGYAVRAGEVQNVPVKLRIVGESAAGRGWHQTMQAGESVRIMTGAPVPEGADSVQQVELTREAGTDEVEILEAVTLGRSIVKRGAEIKAGQTVLHAGELISTATIAVLASFGYDKVDVGKQPRVAVLATGSELVAVDQKPGPDQIRDSNNLTIGAYAELAGAMVERLPLAGDDTSLLKRQIMEAADRSDVVVTSGGVSVGVYDFTKPALRELGAEFFFERVALRPGKPTVFARLPNGALFFGLPGNPVSVSVTFNLFARTAILAMQAATDVTLPANWAVLSHNVKGAGERESYLPATLNTNEDGLLTAEPLRWGGSSDFVGFVRATSLIVVPSNAGLVEAGSRVRILHLPV